MSAFALSRWLPFRALVLLFPLSALPAAPLTQGGVTLTRTIYNGREGYRLSNGKTEAVVVPSLGRVMRYGFLGGDNLLWNAPSVNPGDTPINWGGDKTWPAPQLDWGTGKNWPPHPAWDGDAHHVTVLPHGKLRTTSGVWPEFGLRLVREYSFAPDGDFLIRQTVEKVEGKPHLHAIWSISQVQPEAVFVIANPKSAYPNRFHRIIPPKRPDAIQEVAPSLLMIRPGSGERFKIGVDSPVAAIAAVKKDVAFVLRAARPAGEYPDGALGAGFPVELYDSGGDNPAQHHVELELLSPLRPFRIGSRWTHTVRWSLHHVPGRDVNSAAVQNAVAKLLANEGESADDE